MSARRHDGFTLVEIMISLGLGGLLLAGAFALQTAFNRQHLRQQQVVDMQQSLRIARQVIERAVRSAGAGLDGSTYITTCPDGDPNTFWAVQYSNANGTVAAFPVVKTIFDTNPADADTDSDWLQLISADVTPGTNGTSRDIAGANLCVQDKSKFTDGDLIMVTNTGVSPPRSCVYRVTQVNNACGGGQCASCGGLQRAPGPGGCYNPPPGQDHCMDGAPPGAPVRRLGEMATSVFMVVPAGATPTGQCQNPPCLMLGRGGLGAPLPTWSWQLVAEGIENLQIALIMDDGRACGSRPDPVNQPNVFNSVDCVAGAGCCDPRRARALRFTLTVRSSQAVPGFRLGEQPEVEDFRVAPANDGFLRRTVTTEVQLRNLS